MAAPIEFYFDFSSPYGYFASLEIEELAAAFNRTVDWKPIMLGAAFKASGNQPLISQPLKGAYAVHDWERLARLHGVGWSLPQPFPIGALPAARGFWWLDASDPALARRFAAAAYDAYFVRGLDISQTDVVAALAAGLGIDPDGLRQAVAAPDWKQRLKDETDAAVARGVFGSPFVIVDGEGFWGADRLWMVRQWLERGGW